jgi:hypothetical protein
MMQHPCRYTELPLAQSRGYSIAYEYQRKIMQEIAEVVAAFASFEIHPVPVPTNQPLPTRFAMGMRP